MPNEDVDGATRESGVAEQPGSNTGEEEYWKTKIQGVSHALTPIVKPILTEYRDWRANYPFTSWLATTAAKWTAGGFAKKPLLRLAKNALESPRVPGGDKPPASLPGGVKPMASDGADLWAERWSNWLEIPTEEFLDASTGALDATALTKAVGAAGEAPLEQTGSGVGALLRRPIAAGTMASLGKRLPGAGRVIDAVSSLGGRAASWAAETALPYAEGLPGIGTAVQLSAKALPYFGGAARLALRTAPSVAAIQTGWEAGKEMYAEITDTYKAFSQRGWRSHDADGASQECRCRPAPVAPLELAQGQLSQFNTATNAVPAAASAALIAIVTRRSGFRVDSKYEGHNDV